MTLDATAFQGEIVGLAQSAPITYDPSGVGIINLTSGNGNDQFFILSTAAGTLTNIHGGSGNDFFGIGSPFNTLDPILGPVGVIGGQGGFNTLFVHDDGAAPGHFYSNVNGRIVRTGDGGPQVIINFTGIQSPHLFENPPGGPQAQDLALPRHVRVGAPATLTGRLVDDDPNQVLSLTVDWGGGTVPDQSAPDRGPFAVTHTYASPGVYTVQAIWTDSDGRSNGRELTIRVKPGRTASEVVPGASGDAEVVTGLDAYFALLRVGKDHQGGN